jgi:hypothetical protein
MRKSVIPDEAPLATQVEMRSGVAAHGDGVQGLRSAQNFLHVFVALSGYVPGGHCMIRLRTLLPDPSCANPGCAKTSILIAPTTNPIISVGGARAAMEFDFIGSSWIERL